LDLIKSLFIERLYYIFSKSDFVTPHNGQTQSSAVSSNLVPGFIPSSGSPVSGSYSYPDTPTLYVNEVN